MMSPALLTATPPPSLCPNWCYHLECVIFFHLPIASPSVWV